MRQRNSSLLYVWNEIVMDVMTPICSDSIRLCDLNIDDHEQDTELNNMSYDIDTDADLLTASDCEESEFNANLQSNMPNRSNGEDIDSGRSQGIFHK